MVEGEAGVPGSVMLLLQGSTGLLVRLSIFEVGESRGEIGVIWRKKAFLGGCGMAGTRGVNFSVDKFVGVCFTVR